ncbi:MULTISPECIES: hypothetical protein [unclassified Micromonospora]|uniref:hypothetical protein n=1 Tax=unclassified Micromonospora TaxID=2617518 RepID=UPI0036396ECC
MNAHRMDQETVERLFAGPFGGPVSGSAGGSVSHPQGSPEPLVRLLAAVRAAPRSDELRGEGAALHAYRLARAGSAPPVPAVRARPTLLAGLSSAKAALAALAVAATGGAALAAAHGALPQPLDGADERAAAPASGQPSPSRSTGRTAGSPGGTRDPRVPPAPMVVLCHSLHAEATADRALAEPRYADLVSTAGGRDRVAGWCAEAVEAVSPAAATPTPMPTGRPGVDGGPDGRPGRAPAAPSLPVVPPPGSPASPGNPSVPATPSLPGTPSAPAGRPAPADPSVPATPAAGRPGTASTGQRAPGTPSPGGQGRAGCPRPGQGVHPPGTRCRPARRRFGAAGT